MSSNAKSLVLVLGAGASFEAGFPLGLELKQLIADALHFIIGPGGTRNYNHGDERVFNALCNIANYPAGGTSEINALLASARHIHEAMPLATSIDNFIDSHREDSLIATCGKLAIARCILHAERNSRLYVDSMSRERELRFGDIEATWLNRFFRLLVENTQKKDVEERFRKVGIITFNYDRSVEHYLFHALQRYYRESSEWAAKVLKALEIHHPYGSVGSLPWTSGKNPIGFGDEPSVPLLINLSKQLLTFSEGTNADKSSIELIRRIMTDARRIAFLGFAFHPLNMEILFGDSQLDPMHAGRRVLGTALKVSESDVSVIGAAIRELSKRSGDQVILRDLTCAELFHEYQRSLSLVEAK
jgi:hypothetical protein